MRINSYGLTPDFEAIAALLASTNPRFWGRVGYAVEVDALAGEPAKWALKACAAIAKDTGKGPASAVLVLQRLRRWVQEGKIAIDVVRAVGDLYEQAEVAGVPDVDSAIAELAPIVQRHMHAAVVRTAADEYGRAGDFGAVEQALAAARRVGTVDTSAGLRLGPAIIPEIEAFRQHDRLTTGVEELDFGLDGGLARGGLGVYIGGPGDGKSMALNQAYVAGVLEGLFAVYATLELPEPTVGGRALAALTDVPVNDIMAGRTELAHRRLEELSDVLGVGMIREFTANATTVADLTTWVDQCEQREGRAVDLVVVDYGDKLSAPAAKGEYDAGRVVFEALRVYANERRGWVWTASQATRGTKGGKARKRLDLDDVADSMHKVRVADLVVTLNVRDNGAEQETALYVAKHRTGRSRFEVGPLPVEWHVGRTCAFPRPTAGSSRDGGAW